MSDEEARLRTVTLATGGGMILGGCLVLDIWQMKVTALAMIVCGCLLVWAALSEAGRDEEE